MTTTFAHSKFEIRDFNTAKLASGEANDCVVKAMATALDIDYDTSHNLVKTEMKRERRKGTHTPNIFKAFRKWKREGLKVADKEFSVSVLPQARVTNAYKLHGEVILRKKTVKSFMKDNPKGTYVVLVSRHAFTIKDGVLIDNVGEEFRPTRKVNGAFFVKQTAGTGVQLSLNF